MKRLRRERTVSKVKNKIVLTSIIHQISFILNESLIFMCLRADNIFITQSDLFEMIINVDTNNTLAKVHVSISVNKQIKNMWTFTKLKDMIQQFRPVLNDLEMKYFTRYHEIQFVRIRSYKFTEAGKCFHSWSISLINYILFWNIYCLKYIPIYIQCTVEEGPTITYSPFIV